VTGLPQPSSRAGNSRQGCRCAAGRRCPPGRRGRRRGGGRRSGVVGWAAAVGSPATAVRGQGCRQWSWPRIMPLTSASSKSRSKLGNMLLRPAVDSGVAIELGLGGWRSGVGVLAADRAGDRPRDVLLGTDPERPGRLAAWINDLRVSSPACSVSCRRLASFA
jgi:hypothetical protein